MLLSDASRQRIRLPAYIANHPANRGHVPSALYRACLFQMHARVSGRPVIADLGGLKMWVHAGNTAATKVIYGSPPDWAEMQAWRRLLKPGDLFIDVGANVGTYALWAAACGAEVIAVEPDPIAAERLRANVRLNPQINVQVIEAAATDKSGMTELTTGLDAENHLGTGRQVQSVTLDELCVDRPVAGVKIDVEGFEALVLAGAQTLLGTADAMQLEWNDLSRRAVGSSRDPVASLLIEHGYDLARPDNQGNLIPCQSTGYGRDVFAVRRAPEGAP